MIADPKKCITCMSCIHNCPVKAISLKNGTAWIDPKKCVHCGLCKSICPVNAISGN